MSDPTDVNIQRFARTEVDEDDAREREVYKYYRPLEELYKVTDNPAPLSKAQASPDRSLTAFAQLGTLRLNCRRVLISLLDRRYQYVIAEATRTLSLPKDTVEDEDDSLFFGVNQFTRFGTACCEYAAGLVPAIPGSPGTLPVSGKVLVVPDLREDARFAREPYVTGGPLGRFYAGAPIMSPDNLPIGAYCILDDKPRPEGLSDAELNFVKDMTVTVMQHLEILRTKVELRRCQNMVTGLGNFIAGTSKKDDCERMMGTHSRSDSSHASSAAFSPVIKMTSGRSSEESGMSSGSQASWKTTETSRRFSLPPQQSYALDQGDGTVSGEGEQSQEASFHPKGAQIYSPEDKSKEEARNSLQEESLSDGVHVTFTRAAKILRPAVDLDGAVFLDASIGTFGGMVEKPHGQKVSRANTKVDSPADEEDKACLCLGRSTAMKSRSCPIPESLLRSLLAKYPKGKIWNYEDVDAGSTSDDRSNRENVNRKGSRWEERRLLQRLIPGVRSLAFIGMWDSHRERWYAGSMLWTCCSTRILSAEIELNYLVAFGQSIMSEVAALDTQMADIAKAAFISSISHEFRTPLHGIMGSADCLHTTNLDTFRLSLLETIDICGKTLLDTFDSLLSYAKINYMNGANAKKRSGSTASKSDVLREGTIGMEDNVSLGSLTEEVVDIVFAGSEYMTLGSGVQEAAELEIGGLLTAQHAGAQQRKLGKEPPRSFGAINVSISYANPGSSQWIFQTQPGAWRRIVLNLVGNAVKYTPKGFINIRLETTPLSGAEDRQSSVSLTVTDSGKGMSPAFLQSKLFSPFVQEDPLSPGTGLGMSIVKQIIESMNGHINVRSKQGEGTEINVNIPLVRGTSNVCTASVIHSIPEKCESFRLKILGNVLSASGLGDAVWTFADICNKSFGLATDFDTESGQDELYVTSEKTIRTLAGSLPSLFPQEKQYSRRALIVLCKDSASARAFKNLRVATAFFHMIACISQPFGPTRVAKCLTPCLDYLRNSHDPRALKPSSPTTRIFPASAGATPLVYDDKGSTTAFPFGFPALSSPTLSIEAAAAYHQSSRSDPGVETIPNLELKAMQVGTGDIVAGPSKNALLAVPMSSGPDIDTGITTTMARPSLTHSASTPLLQDEGKAPTRLCPVYTVASAKSSVPQLVASSSSKEVSIKTDRPTPLQSSSAPLLQEKIRPSTLLVDDNPVNLKILSAYMLKHKRQYSLAENGLEALEAYKAAVPSDLADSPELSRGFVAYEHVFMDLNMPVMGGLVATRKIRTFEAELSLKPAKIIAVTEMASASAQQEAYASGIDLFMTKPVRLKEMSQILEIK